MIDLTTVIRTIPDYPKPGIEFRDVTPLFGHAAAFSQTIASMAERYRGRGFASVAGSVLGDLEGRVAQLNRQGAALTAWELGQHGVPHTVIPDNTGGHLMQHGMVDMVIVGTDRTTRQGDVASKAAWSISRCRCLRRGSIMRARTATHDPPEIPATIGRYSRNSI